MAFSTLVDAATLAAHRDDHNWRVVDVRHQLADTGYGERAYAEAHIPGAVFLHCDRDLSGPINGMNGRHPLPDPVVLAARLGALGVGPETQLVVYDDAQGMVSGRLWWLMRWLGHTRVAVLDGGLQAWLAAGGSLDSATPCYEARQYMARQQFGIVNVDDVESFLQTSQIYLIDARSPDRYRGENESIDPVGGHIPGAVNRFFRENLQSDGRFKPAAELRQEWLGLLGNIPPDKVVHQCGSGVSACHNLLAMEHAGLTGSRLYPGSWSEWCADPKRPVAR